jgi:hypothetical protein
MVAMALAAAGCGTTSPSSAVSSAPSSSVAFSTTPGAPEPSATPFAKSSELHANLAALSTASGEIQGTLMQGTTPRTLSGTVAFNGPSSSIDLIEGGPTKPHRDEIVAGGKRYLRLDDGPWVNHGSRTADTGLSTVLKAAATDADEGVHKLGDAQLHRIVTPANTQLAGALGLETWNWTNLNSTLRIWSDDAGAVRGFGASMSWTQPVDGVAQLQPGDRHPVRCLTECVDRNPQGRLEVGRGQEPEDGPCRPSELDQGQVQ